LTPECLFTFKQEKSYKSPTEVLVLKECTTVKSAEDEIQKEFTFVNLYERE